DEAPGTEALMPGAVSRRRRGVVDVEGDLPSLLPDVALARRAGREAGARSLGSDLRHQYTATSEPPPRWLPFSRSIPRMLASSSRQYSRARISWLIWVTFMSAPPKNSISSIFL